MFNFKIGGYNASSCSSGTFVRDVAVELSSGFLLGTRTTTRFQLLCVHAQLWPAKCKTVWSSQSGLAKLHSLELPHFPTSEGIRSVVVSIHLKDHTDYFQNITAIENSGKFVNQEHLVVLYTCVDELVCQRCQSFQRA